LQVVALHNDRYIFPLTIAVTKVSGSGADAIFMGVLKLLPEVPDVVNAWLVPAGVCLLRLALSNVGLANNRVTAQPTETLLGVTPTLNHQPASVGSCSQNPNTVSSRSHTFKNGFLVACLLRLADHLCTSRCVLQCFCFIT
jgi:hypothetical protein